MKLNESQINSDRKQLLWNLYPSQLKVMLNGLAQQISSYYNDETDDDESENFELLKILYQEIILSYEGCVNNGLESLKWEDEELVTLYNMIIAE
jgi:hypothetical protein